MPVLLRFLLSILGFLFSKAVPKFLLFISIYFVVLEFVPILSDLMGIDHILSRLSSLFGGLDSGISYFLSVFRIETGFKVIFSAYVIRFIIRRIPIIG